MQANRSMARLLAASVVLTLSGAPDVWAWGASGGGAPPVAAADPQPRAAAASPAQKNAAAVMSLLEEARRRASQVRAQTDKLKASLTQRVAVIRQAPSNAAYAGLQSAVASAAPGIDANLTALIRIGNTLTADVSR